MSLCTPSETTIIHSINSSGDRVFPNFAAAGAPKKMMEFMTYMMT